MNKQSKNYKKRHSKGQFFTDPLLVEKVIELFNIDHKKKHILEPSCGDGIFVKSLLNKDSDCTITAVDIDKDPLEKLSKYLHSNNFNNVELIKKDFMSYSSKKKYDLIIGNPPFNVKPIGYVDTVEGFISKSIEMLSDGGELVFVIPSTLFRNKKYERIRKKILNETTIIEIFNSNSYDFEGADIETSVIHLLKKKTINQCYNYYSNGECKKIILKTNSRYNILLDNTDYYISIINSIHGTTLGDLFNISRGRSTNNILKGRSIDFFSNFQDLNSGTDLFIAVQNIAYRLTANGILGNIGDANDTITVLKPKIPMPQHQLSFIAAYLNSSIANYLLHVNCLNNSRLTIHIDSYYISDLFVPYCTEEDMFNLITLCKNSEKDVEIASIRNNFFEQLFQLEYDAKKAVNNYWTVPRYKRK